MTKFPFFFGSPLVDDYKMYDQSSDIGTLLFNTILTRNLCGTH